MNISNKSSFQLVDYKIQKLFFDNPFADLSGDSSNLSYFAVSSKEYTDGHWEGSVALGFKTSINSDDSENILFEGVILGEFSDPGCTDSISGDEFVTKLRINGSSTLIPILRAAACSGSALMGFPGKYTLPNINVFTLEWNDNSFEQ